MSNGNQRMVESLKKERQPVVEQCLKGNNEKDPVCSKVNENVCDAYAFPSSKWRNNQHCPLATNIINEEEVTRGKVRVGQQKQKKKKR